METINPRNPSLTWKAAVDVLIRGRDLASQLGAILEVSLPTSTDRGLLRKISDSFSRALVALNSRVKLSEDTRSVDNSGGGGRDKREESVCGKKRERESRQRGGGCPRRVNNSPCKSVKTTTLKDGHSWRKYGQKVILNSKSPRGYYRCTHKNDQNCLATRRVQQSEENPSLFVITYTGEHTCRDQVLADTSASTSLQSGTFIIDFTSCTSSTATMTTVSNQDQHGSTSSGNLFVLAANQESDEQVVRGEGGGNDTLKSFGSSDESSQLAKERMGGASVSKHNDVVTSCLLRTSSLGDLDWDLMGYDYSIDINCIFDYSQRGTLY